MTQYIQSELCFNLFIKKRRQLAVDQQSKLINNNEVFNEKNILYQELSYLEFCKSFCHSLD